MTELFELEWTFKGHLVQIACNDQRHAQLDLFAQSLVQPDLECLQEQSIHYLSGQQQKSYDPADLVCPE